MAIDTTNLVKFSKGSLAGYQAKVNAQEVNNNTVYITTDEGGIYLGTKRLGDYVKAVDINALKALQYKSQDALYYAEAENVLARWNGSNWVQINAAGLTSLETRVLTLKDKDNADIQGNVITEVVADQTGKVTATKGFWAADGKDIQRLDSEIGDIQDTLSTLLGTDSEVGGTIASQIEAAINGVIGGENDEEGALTISNALKNAAAAQATANGAAAQANTNKGNIDTLNGTVGTLNDSLAALTDGAESKTFVDLEGKIQANSDAIAALANDKDGRVTLLESNFSQLSQTVINNKSEVDTALSTVNDTLGSHTDTLATLTQDMETVAPIKTVVSDAIANVVADAPDAFDTLKEIADWIGSDETDTGAAEMLVDYGNRINTLETAITNPTTGLNTKVAANADAIQTLRDNHNTDKGNLEKAIADAEDAANDYTDQEITDLIDGAKTYTTLKLVEGAIETNISNIADNKSAISDINGDIEGINNNIDALGGKNGRVTALENELNAETTGLKARLTAVEGKATDNANNFTTLNGTVNSHTDSIQDILDLLTWGNFDSE